MLGGHQAGENLHPALADDEVMIAAAKGLAAAFDDPHPAPLAAIDRRELIEVDDAVRDTMDGAVGRLGGEIVEQDDGRIVSRRNSASARASDGGSATSSAPAGGSRTGCRSPPASASPARSRRKCAGRSRRARGRRNRAGSGADPDRARCPAGPARHIELSPIVQPCEAAPSRSSCSVSARLTYMPTSPASAPASRNCRAIVVLPVPGLPSSRCRRLRASPPPKI